MSTLNSIINYIGIYNQPLSGLIIGLAIIGFVGHINWYGTVKADTIRWIAKCIFRDEFRSKVSADGLLLPLPVSCYRLAVCGLFLLFSILVIKCNTVN